MRLGLIGGILLLGACLLAIVVAGIFATGGSVGLGVRDVGGLVLAAALAFGGLGFGLVGLAGAQPLDRRSLRIGFVLLGVGLLANLGSAAIAATLTYDPLENGPAVILLFMGGLAMLLGGPLTVIALLRSPGRPRRIGVLFVSGLLLAVVAGVLVNSVFAYTSMDTPALHLAGGVVALVGGSLMLIACGALGLLALRSERSNEVGS